MKTEEHCYTPSETAEQSLEMADNDMQADDTGMGEQSLALTFVSEHALDFVSCSLPEMSTHFILYLVSPKTAMLLD